VSLKISSRRALIPSPRPAWSYASVVGPRLSRADLEGVLAFVGLAAEVDSDEPFTEPLLRELEGLFHGATTEWFEVVEATCEVVRYGVSRDVWWDAALWADCVELDPIKRSGDMRLRSPVTYSQFLDRRARSRDPFVHLWLHPTGHRDKLYLSLPAPAGLARSFVADRFDRDFSERDREVASVLAPHLTRLWTNADLRRTAVREAAPETGLTPRQLEILRLAAQGRTNGEIARILFISPGTVRKHMDNTFATLGVHNRTAAAVVAFAQLNPLS